MKTSAFLTLLFSIFMVVLPASAEKDLPKIAVWDLAPRNTPDTHAQELTSILVSEISKLKKYEVYSQDNVRALAGWAAERMKLGCTDTQCLTALGQMDIAKLIAGSVGKIGNTYSISLNLFDTQKAKAENAISEFCRTEDELIPLVQQTVRRLLGEPGERQKVEDERQRLEDERRRQEVEAKRQEDERKKREDKEKPAAMAKIPLKTLTNSIGMQLVLIPEGTFMMGSPGGEGEGDERPRHKVTISRPFYLQTTEVTQGQWRAVMGSNPSRFKGDDRPVENINWEGIQEFIRRLNAKEGTDKYRLPTEAEWEYACRAGSEGKWAFGDDAKQLGEYAWYKGNSGKETHPVGKKRANAWGLYDMHGNVYELCQDRYNQVYYSGSPELDPQGPSSGEERVLRGGSWDEGPNDTRCAYRNKQGQLITDYTAAGGLSGRMGSSYPQSLRGDRIGFRLAGTF